MVNDKLNYDTKLEIAQLLKDKNLHLGWPNVSLEVWHRDKYGRNELYGYSMCYIPSSPGHHKISCPTWKPIGSFKEQIMSKLLGGGVRLKNTNLIHTGVDRYHLRTVAMGSVDLNVFVVMRNFERYGVEY
ncbi:B9 domain-containing protein 2 [Intoshia linei]|uniref:B9 domain-containing protein 2 n=1 Tax=Intoshia linei TaxID=1819745 RepID=A0A177B0E3_9BILA|nr:B9 domain-containing protein 2 [Intoshia linei]